MSRSVVLTGASSGIGAELPVQLARRGRLRAMPDWLYDAICSRIQRPPPHDQPGGEPSR